MIAALITLGTILALLVWASSLKRDAVRPLTPADESKYDLMHYNPKTNRYLIVEMTGVKHAERKQDAHCRA